MTVPVVTKKIKTLSALIIQKNGLIGRPKSFECFWNQKKIFGVALWFDLKKRFSAYGIWEPLAVRGDSRAQVEVGKLRRDGWGIGQDYTSAVLWFMKAAKQGSGDGQLNLSLMYENGWGVRQSNQQCIDWLRKAADQGRAESQYRLASFYHRGRVAERDGQKALFWFRKAASQGYAKALAIGRAIYGPNFMTLKPEPSVD